MFVKDWPLIVFFSPSFIDEPFTPGTGFYPGVCLVSIVVMHCHCKCQDRDTLFYPALRHMNLFRNWDKQSVVLLSATGMWIINLLWCINALDTWLFIEIIILQAISQICTGAGIRGQEGWRNVQQVQHSACGNLCFWSQDQEISVLRTCEKMSTVCHWWFTATTLF